MEEIHSIKFDKSMQATDESYKKLYELETDLRELRSSIITDESPEYTKFNREETLSRLSVVLPYLLHFWALSGERDSSGKESVK